jgi:hypothetical protein
MNSMTTHSSTASKTIDPIMMVYRTSSNTWRGFVHPYNISTETKTRKAAVDALRAMNALYVEALEEYNYPAHLSFKELLNSADKAFYEKSITSLNKLGLSHVETLYR